MSDPAPIRKSPSKFRRRLIPLATLALLVVITANAIAFMQARSMTHFVPTGSRPPAAATLTTGEKLKMLFTGIQYPRPENTATPADVGLNFQIVRFGGPADDDCEAWFIPSPNSKGLCIQFHGYTACKSSLLGQAKAFHDLGYDTLLVDFQGSGGSHGNETTIGYREADDVASAVNFAQRRLPPEPIILYGQSMGGAAILRAVAQLNVNPSAIIIESTYDRLLSTAQNRFHVVGLPAFPFAQLLVFWGGEQIGCNAFQLNPADYAKNVHCPVLIFQAGRDPRVTDAQARNIYDHLAGPKQFEEFQNSDHCQFLTKDPTRWTACIQTFLEKWR